MKRYTLEEREGQIKFHRAYIQNMIRYYSELTTGSELDQAIVIYLNLLDHIDKVFGKEETE